MSFQPVIPFGGQAGWAFLKRTMARQAVALQASPAVKRDEDYFRAKIGKVTTAEQLVSDRRLLRISLEAFGLGGDIDNKAFIRKVLTDGTLKEGALSNRLADKQYQKFSAAFGFGDFTTPRTQLSDFADKILSLYQARSFETAVGSQNNSFRLALNAERELGKIAASSSSDDTKWFTIMGNAPLREVFQTALGLPSSFASIDLDQQLSVLKSRTRAQFGRETVGQFAEPAALDKLVKRFLAMREINGFAASTSGPSAALTLLQRL